LRKDIRSEKKQLIAANLSLTDTEATKFWPVYDQYQAESRKIGDAKLALIKEYAQNWGTVTDQQALDYLKRSEEISEFAIQVRKKYLPLVNQVLAGKKTATFFQLKRRIEMLMDVQVGIAGSTGAEPRSVGGKAKVVLRTHETTQETSNNPGPLTTGFCYPWNRMSHVWRSWSRSGKKGVETFDPTKVISSLHRKSRHRGNL
jgi:hypothetical protein